MNNIRNFAIIAHVDHGKSTLADRLLEITHTVEAGHHDEQMLDRNPISRERGITIKLAPVRMKHQGLTLNLIDTPGHVDFSYEVDRTLSCVEGVILLVDATQGIQAQTIANAYKAIEKNLVIIAAVNKIDLASADIAGSKKQLVDFLGIPEGEIFEISAKTGQGVTELLEAVIKKIPSPMVSFGSAQDKLAHHDNSVTRSHPEPVYPVRDEGQTKSDTQALIFDSYYDSHRGVIAFVRVFSGAIKKGDKMRLANSASVFEAQDIGFFSPDLTSLPAISDGNIGYIATNLKDIHQVQVGDTIVDAKSEPHSFPGYKKVNPMVFASVFPTLTADYLNLKKALEKLYLNDSALQFSAIYSKALGAGFRVGFLGLLHADVVRERLEREFNLSLVLTPPQVDYRIEDGIFLEPYVKIMIITPQEHVGSVMQLVQNYRGVFITMDNKNKTLLSYEMPMSELMSDFFDRLKSVTSGFASLDWEFLRYQKADAARLEVLLNGETVDEFSEVVVAEKAFDKARFITSRLRELIPRQQYEVKVQAQYKGKIIASERISPFRKNVLVKSGKVIGAGDVGRKKKLLEKQKEGKKKMKMVGHVEIPKEAFFNLFNKK